MMIVMKEGATEEQIQAVVDRVESVGCSAHVSPGEVLTVIGAAADNDVDMRVLRIPVVDSHPVEPGPEVTLRLRHQLPGKSLEIRQLGRVVRRYDEPEMMPVALAPRCEGTMVGVIPLGIEHATSGPVFGYALTPQIGQMSTERNSAHPVPHHARLYNHST